ncbi:autotransporter domain-containing protein [Candidatus Pelagibacter sp. Uisw_137]|uniref:autotransporter domain-containing protein n=1 Tax=Candidatus Pelagibacter sp. Uisw_137 TaxID=3230992 RepID=UPI0039E95AE3
MKFFLKKLIKYSFIFFITMTLLLSKVLAEPTFIADFNIRSDEASATGITFKPDGTKMYITGVGTDKILQYNLTTAFDITSATLEKSVLIQTVENKPQDVKFNSDGTVIFILGTNDDGIDRWSLSTPYDIGSITVADTLFTSIGGDPRGFDFNNDGTKMFILNQTNTRVEEYNLSTPYNPDTKTLTNTLANAKSGNFHQGLGFNADGSKMFVVKSRGSSNAHNKIDEYALSTAFDISTATLTGTFSPTHDNAENISGMAFNVSGTKMYHINWADDEVREYSLTCPFKVTSSSTCDTPLKDKDVRGIIDAQINTAKNFANDSSQSALKRLTILRANKGYNTNAQKVELLFQNELFNKISNNVSSSTPAKLNPLHQIQKGLPENWTAWTEGSIRFGKIGDSSLSSAQDMDSLGITVGADKIDNDKIVGVALRVGYSDVDVGTFGSAVDTNALSLSVYGSNSLNNRNFLKHVFGVSYLDTNILRVYEGQSVKNAGSRKGKQAFGSLNFGREYEDGDVIITPTAHIDGSYTTLDSYTESGPASSALSFNKQHIRSLMASLGVLIDRDHNLENSTLKSRFNLEYGKEFASDSHVITKYVTDDESFDYRANQKDLNILTVGQGFDFVHNQGLIIRTDYQRQKIFGKGFINELFLSIGFISRKKTEFALGLDEDMTSSFKISKALNGFDLGFNLENDFSKQENYNADLSLSSKF